MNWISAHEDTRLKTDGFVPPDNSGQPLESSGVTIGYGVDLGDKTAAGLAADGVRSDTLKLLLPYLGLRKSRAAAALKNVPLNLTAQQATKLTQAVLNDNIRHIAKLYDTATKPGTFESLPVKTQTAIADIGYQYYNLPMKAPRFWSYITTGRWTQAINELNKYGDRSPNRRQDEAGQIESDLAAGLLSK